MHQQLVAKAFAQCKENQRLHLLQYSPQAPPRFWLEVIRKVLMGKTPALSGYSRSSFCQVDAVVEGRAGIEPISITPLVSTWELDLQGCYLNRAWDFTNGIYLTLFLHILHPSEMYLANFRGTLHVKPWTTIVNSPVSLIHTIFDLDDMFFTIFIFWPILRLLC